MKVGKPPSTHILNEVQSSNGLKVFKLRDSYQKQSKLKQKMGRSELHPDPSSALVYQHGLKIMLLQLYKWKEGAASNIFMFDCGFLDQ